jgi:hypothetical protein
MMTTVNRIATHLDTPADRSRVWSDALFAAVAALQDQLSHPNAEIVREAATLLIDLEKTRLRHDRPLSGTAECTPHPPCAVDPELPAAGADHLTELPPLSAAESEAALDRLTRYVEAVEKGEIEYIDDDDFDDEIDDEPAIAPPPPKRVSLAELLQARFAATGRELPFPAVAEPAQT